MSRHERERGKAGGLPCVRRGCNQIGYLEDALSLCSRCHRELTTWPAKWLAGGLKSYDTAKIPPRIWAALDAAHVECEVADRAMLERENTAKVKVTTNKDGSATLHWRDMHLLDGINAGANQ